MFISALCPTFRHPELLAASVAHWEAQDYPAHLRRLIIFDDAQTFADQETDTWELKSWLVRFPSLPAKWNALFHAAPPESDAFLPWEDDNTYLPGHLSAHARVLESCELSSPDFAYVDTNGPVQRERINGWHHPALGFRRELIERVGGWPDTKRADFDYQLISQLNAQAGSKGDPWPDGRSQYVFGWNTGAAHTQWAHRGPDDETWYERCAEIYAKVPYLGRLVPQLDERSRRIFDQVAALEKDRPADQLFRAQ